MTTIASPVEHAEEHHGDHHPSDAVYWKVGLFLAVLTAIEVWTYWWPESLGAITPVSLIFMMVIKFAVVAGFFMHLKFDKPILRNFFVAGILIAVAVYIAALGAMLYFNDSGVAEFNDPPITREVPPPVTSPPPPQPPGATPHHA